MNISAQTIAEALGGDRIGPDRYMARCPAHDDRNPSFAITQTSEMILLYCFAGCPQGEVIEALRRRDLWPEEKPPAEIETLIDREEMLTFCLVHESNLKRDIPTSTAEKRLYRQFQRVLCKPFTPGEIVEMDLYCRCYSADVKAGKTPTADEHETFMLYQKIVVEVGVLPYAW
jgi:hypothetical protein